MLKYSEYFLSHETSKYSYIIAISALFSKAAWEN